MLVVTLSPLTFSGKNYRRGDVWEIRDGHRRLEALIRGRHIAYCQRSGAKPGDNIFHDSGIRVVVEEEIHFTKNEGLGEETKPDLDRLLEELKTTT